MQSNNIKIIEVCGKYSAVVQAVIRGEECIFRTDSYESRSLLIEKIANFIEYQNRLQPLKQLSIQYV